MNEFIETSNSTNPDPLYMGDFVEIEEVVVEKMKDAMTPGYEVEFTPEEAEVAGAFEEDALSESDAAESAGDDPQLSDAVAPAVP